VEIFRSYSDYWLRRGKAVTKEIKTPAASRGWGRTGRLRYLRKLSPILCGLIFPTNLLEAANHWGSAHGPLDGRNLHTPYISWFSFPANSATPLPFGTIRAGTALYFLNEFVTKGFNADDYSSIADSGKLSAYEQDELILIDYESTVVEFSFDWQAFNSWRFSADWRMHFRYGGFFDQVIEWWHGIFGFPNAGREYFDNYRSYWSIRSEKQWQASGSIPGAGDVDLQALWSFWSNSELFLAAVFAFKLPTGRSDLRYGSGFPDIGMALLLDWYPRDRWGFYLNTGIVIPLAGEGHSMIQVIPAVEFRMFPDISILTQLNIQSTPFIGEMPFTHKLFGRVNHFTLPQTSIKIGFKGHVGRFGWQAYVEEDILTWEGPDILFHLGVTWSFQTSSPKTVVPEKEKSPVETP